MGAYNIVEGEELLAGSYPSNLVSFCDKDILHWSASINVMYSCSHTWDAICVKRQIVDWWSLVWFPSSIPKQAFVTWLAMRDALPTGTKLLCWGFQGDEMYFLQI